ncbi:hypothetical protein BDW68DRAFT_178143 [Aspergillus falconensis]
MILAELAKDAGFPPGVITPAEVKAISFIGDYRAGAYVYTHGCATGKCVQANLGVMNHTAVLPNATDYQCHS